MCGITGWVSNNEEIDQSMLDNMIDLLEHRGPDDRGSYICGKYGIGMRRLSIIDLNSGHQPIHNHDKSLSIVFNGEIYNYKKLKARLLQKGYSFRTNSDTETILNLYAEYGEEAPKYLKGMFAFSIVDRKQDKLFIARDRFGIKPLYYYESKGDFLFASEIKSILKNPLYSNGIDLKGVDQYFKYGYVPGSDTLFEGIKKLPPASSLVVNNGMSDIKKYWSYPEKQSEGYNEKQHLESLEDILRSSVERHMISEVPLGAFLSGGVDSSLIVAMMSEIIGGERLETFSVGYDKSGLEYDETEYSDIVSKHCNTNHHKFILEPDIINLLPEMVKKFDQPVGDASIIPNYFLSQQTRKHVTVALSGLGGDELCGGYERHLGGLLADKYDLFPRILRENVIAPIIESLPDSKTGSNLPNRLKRFVRTAHLPLEQRYQQIISKFNNTERSSLLPENGSQMIANNSLDYYSQLWSENKDNSALLQMLYIDMNMYIPDDLLLLSDSMSMQNSLEMRVPFLDHDVVEYFWSLPDRYKIRKFEKKYLLKKLAEKYLPKEVIYRKKKGFSVPLTVWFRNNLKEYVSEVLSESNIKNTGIFNYSYVESIINEHNSGMVNHDEKIFMLIVFMLWYRQYFQ